MLAETQLFFGPNVTEISRDFAVTTKRHCSNDNLSTAKPIAWCVHTAKTQISLLSRSAVGRKRHIASSGRQQRPSPCYTHAFCRFWMCSDSFSRFSYLSYLNTYIHCYRNICVHILFMNRGNKCISNETCLVIYLFPPPNIAASDCRCNIKFGSVEK